VQTRAGLRWRRQAATVNYRPVLSLERALQNNKLATVYRKSQGERKIRRGSQLGAWHHDELADWLSVVMWFWLLLTSCWTVWSMGHLWHAGSRWDSLGRGTVRRKASTHTGQYEHRINADIKASNGIWTLDASVWLGEESSCLTFHGHYYRQFKITRHCFQLNSCIHALLGNSNMLTKECSCYESDTFTLLHRADWFQSDRSLLEFRWKVVTLSSGRKVNRARTTSSVTVIQFSW
jgi:hypothetical protein